MFCVRHVFLSVYCSLLAICWENTDLLALLFVIFIVFFHFANWIRGWSSRYFTEGYLNLPLESYLIQLLLEASIPAFLRKCIVNLNFPERGQTPCPLYGSAYASNDKVFCHCAPKTLPIDINNAYLL